MKMKYTSTFSLFIILLSYSTICLSENLDESKTITSFGSVVLNMVTYFECSFSEAYPPQFGLNVPWPEDEPCAYPCEKGIWNWVNTQGSWLPYAGTIRLVSDPEMSGRACAEFILNAEETRPLPDNQHTKLYNVQYRQPENWGEPYLSTKEAYWNMKYWIPNDLDVQNWRLFWQYCGEYGIYGGEGYAQHPQMAIYFFAPKYGNGLMLKVDGFYFDDGQRREFKLMDVNDFPKDRWVAITVFVKQGSSFRAQDGTVILWVDGVKVFERHDLPTSTYSSTPYVVWGIGNYGNGEELYGQSLLIKDVIVSSKSGL